MAEIPDKIGKYVIDSILGKGGMGEVYKAHDSSLGRYVALKIMRGPSLDDTYARERFIREAQAAGGLRHPNIVTIYDLGNVEDQLYIAMEFIHGQDLDKLIRAKAPLSIDEKINIMVQVCEGISYAHKHQIVHRDLKPSNIRIDEEGIVKIMDFGIAHLESSNMTASGMVLGTPYYMSPEQVRGMRVDARSDLFALGAILYEVFAYEKPFTGEMTAVFYKIAHEQPAPLSEFLNIPAEPLQRVINRCLEKDKNARVQTAQEVSQMLREAQTAYRELNVATLDGVETVNLSPEAVSLKLTSVPAAVDTARRLRTSTSGSISKAAPAASPTQLIQPATPPGPDTTADRSVNPASPLAQTELISRPSAGLAQEPAVPSVPIDAPSAEIRKSSGSKTLFVGIFILLVLTVSGFALYELTLKNRSVPSTNEESTPIPKNQKIPGSKEPDVRKEDGIIAPDTSKEFARAKGFYKTAQTSSDYDQVIQMCNAIVQKNPKDANAYFLMGAAKQKLMKKQEALISFQQAVDLDPNIEQAWQGIGFILQDRMDYENARKAFQRAIAINPGSAASWQGLAQTYDVMDNLQSAEEAYKKLVEIEPQNVAAVYNLGRIQMKKKDLEGAQKSFQKTIELNPNYAEAHNNLGLIYLQNGKIEQSILENERALQLKPELASAHYNLSVAYEQKHDFKRAAEHLKKYLEITKDDSPDLKKKLEEYEK